MMIEVGQSIVTTLVSPIYWVVPRRSFARPALLVDSYRRFFFLSGAAIAIPYAFSSGLERWVKNSTVEISLLTFQPPTSNNCSVPMAKSATFR